MRDYETGHLNPKIGGAFNIRNTAQKRGNYRRATSIKLEDINEDLASYQES